MYIKKYCREFEQEDNTVNYLKWLLLVRAMTLGKWHFCDNKRYTLKGK